jgi:hypothetical protein
MWWSILAPVLFLGDPLGSDLVLDGPRLDTFVKKHAPALLRVGYEAPLRPGQDARFRTLQETFAVAVTDGDGQPVILAPAHRLRGVRRATLRLGSGTRFAVAVQPSDTPDEVPFVRLSILEAPIPEGLMTLTWAADASVAEGRQGWLLEAPLNSGEMRGAASPVVARATLGHAVEPPLERFVYVSARRADGLPVLDGQGRVLCVVFREVPGVEGTSLCAPRAIALSPRFDRPPLLAPRASP